MAAVRPVIQWVGLALTLLMVVPAPSSAADADVDLRQRVMTARAAFLSAIDEARWDTVASMIWTFQLEPSDALQVVEAFREAVLADRQAGIVLRDERVEAVHLHAEAGLNLAILNVAQRYENPAAAGLSSTWTGRVYAISKDHGNQWRFNVLGCVDQPTVLRLFPGLQWP